ncbi:STAS domain-containing protein [Chloroflexia bacterium SDU3-3]|nr:STAS domain-containing protein [Chloroflexia bacterium SDU3-3]
MPTLTDLFQQHFSAIVEDVAIAVVAQAGGGYQQQQIEQFRPSAERGMALYGRDIAEGKQEHFASFWLMRAPERVRSGYGIEEMMRSIMVANEIVIRHLLPHYQGDMSGMQAMITQVCAIADHAKLALFRAVERAHQEVIQELSAPIVPIVSGVLVMPLVGTLDDRRASGIIATLLTEITEQQARIVLLDITGVPVVDTDVAHHLIQAARAVKLLGADMVLVGIRPEIAQTIVQLGVSLSDMATCANLQAGFAYAMQRLGRGEAVAW